MNIVTHIHSDFIFTYGSNLAGVNGMGAAGIAKRFYAAVDGVGEGFSGSHCYALPTKDKHIQTRDIAEVYHSIDKFLAVATRHPNKKFMLTRIGCGLAGFSDSQMTEYLSGCNIPTNVYLPGTWLNQMNKLDTMRVIVAGGQSFVDTDMMQKRLQTILAQTDRPIEIVSGTAKGADKAGEDCAPHLPNVDKIIRFPAQWNLFNKPAGFLRNSAMSWYATHAIIFWDGVSPGSKDMIKRSEAENLKVRVCRYE